MTPGQVPTSTPSARRIVAFPAFARYPGCRRRRRAGPIPCGNPEYSSRPVGLGSRPMVRGGSPRTRLEPKLRSTPRPPRAGTILPGRPKWRILLDDRASRVCAQPFSIPRIRGKHAFMFGCQRSGLDDGSTGSLCGRASPSPKAACWWTVWTLPMNYRHSKLTAATVGMGLGKSQPKALPMACWPAAL